MQRVLLSDSGWSDTHDDAFRRLNAALAAQVTLSYPDDTLVTCVFTDASQTAWSGVVTQVPAEQLSLPV